MSLLPTDPKERKKIPLWSGVFKYFPLTMIELAKLSYVGNEQHNPGEPLHWAREKSADQEDTLLRHLLDQGEVDTDGIRHCVKVVWRACAASELELENAKKEIEANAGGAESWSKSTPLPKRVIVRDRRRNEILYEGVYRPGQIVPCYDPLNVDQIIDYADDSSI